MVATVQGPVGDPYTDEIEVDIPDYWEENVKLVAIQLTVHEWVLQFVEWTWKYKESHGT